MPTNPSLLFNGKSIRNAIIQKLAEDHNLTSAMFSNANITILVDIISYMYQSLMTNLRFAASESMFTDTMLFENATRLAKLIGYYAKGAYPYSLIARIENTETSPTAGLLASFLSTTLTYGPYSFNFALVDDVQVSELDQQYVKLVLGDWTVANFTSTGIKFEEFELANTPEKYISQQHVKVFVNGDQWFYSDTPVFAQLTDPTTSDDSQRRLAIETAITDADAPLWYRYNFYLDENNNYILRFGDGLGSALPPVDAKIVIVYITATATANTITQDDITAIANSSASSVKYCDAWSEINGVNALNGSLTRESLAGVSVLPITKLGGFKAVDTVESIKTNSMQAFSRQQRVVTKSDYKSYMLEHDSGVVDCVVQNNWDLIASYYGYIYNLAKQVDIDSDDTTEVIAAKFLEEAANKAFGTTIDAADANNVYLWTLRDTQLALNDGWTVDDTRGLGTFGVAKNDILNGLTLFDKVKNVTEHVVELTPIWRTYCPFVTNIAISPTNYIQLNSMQNLAGIDSAVTGENSLINVTKTKINIYADLRYISNIARIKSGVNRLIKQYLYDDIKLGVSPNINQLLKQLLNITGVNSVTTMYYDADSKETREVQGLQFLSWTAVDIVNQGVCFDTMLTYGLPQINPFEYLKCAIGYSDFITYFINILPDYNRSK